MIMAGVNDRIKFSQINAVRYINFMTTSIYRSPLWVTLSHVIGAKSGMPFSSYVPIRKAG